MTSVPPTNNDDPDETPKPGGSPSNAPSPASSSPAEAGTGSAGSTASGGDAGTDSGTASGGGTGAASPASTASPAGGRDAEGNDDLLAGEDSATFGATPEPGTSGADPGATTSGIDPGATSAPSAADSGAASAHEPASASGPDAATTGSAGSAEEAASAAPAAAAPGRSSHAAPRPTPSSADDAATHRLPTEEEDEALRAERERRFGRVAGSSATAETTAEPVPEPAEPAEAGPEEAPAAGEPQTTTMTPTAPPQEEEDPFADFAGGPASRAAAHWWGILIAIVFGPVTWYLIADGGERVSYALSQNLDAINVLGLVELAGGLVTLVIMLLAARWSSVGSIIIGSIGALVGGAFVIIPGIVADFLSSQSMIFDRLGQFGNNVFDHLAADGHSGRLLAYGVAFIFVGVVSHGARRQGRREERRRAALGE